MTPVRFIDIPDVRQPDNFSCGSCCAQAVSMYFGVGPKTREEWNDALGTSAAKSTDPKRIIAYLQSLGLTAVGRQKMTTADLLSAWQAGSPVICPIQEYGVPTKQASFDYGHYVVVIGVDHGYVTVQDPSYDNTMKGEDSDAAPGRMIIPVDRFTNVWHDRGADGTNYFHYGITVSKPSSITAEKLKRGVGRSSYEHQITARPSARLARHTDIKKNKNYWSFLNTLADAQDRGEFDSHTAKVFADWLEEHGDARHHIARAATYGMPRADSPRTHPLIGGVPFTGSQRIGAVQNVTGRWDMSHTPMPTATPPYFSDPVDSHQDNAHSFVRLLNQRHVGPISPMPHQAPVLWWQAHIPRTVSTKAGEVTGRPVSRTVSLSAPLSPDALHDYIRALPRGATQKRWAAAATAMYGKPTVAVEQPHEPLGEPPERMSRRGRSSDGPGRLSYECNNTVRLARHTDIKRERLYWAFLNHLADAQDRGEFDQHTARVFADWLEEHGDARHHIARAANNYAPVTEGGELHHHPHIPGDQRGNIGMVDVSRGANNPYTAPVLSLATGYMHPVESHVDNAHSSVRLLNQYSHLYTNDHIGRAPVLWWQAHIPRTVSTKKVKTLDDVTRHVWGDDAPESPDKTVSRTVSLSAPLHPDQLHDYIRSLPRGATQKRWAQAATALYGKPSVQSHAPTEPPERMQRGGRSSDSPPLSKLARPGELPWSERFKGYHQSRFTTRGGNYTATLHQLAPVPTANPTFESTLRERLPEYGMQFSRNNPERLAGDMHATKSGHAADVFRHAARLAKEALHRFTPGALTFTASEPSRQRLYDNLAGKVKLVHPEYTGFRVMRPNPPRNDAEGNPIDVGMHAHYALVHKSHIPAYLESAAKHGVVPEALDTIKPTSRTRLARGVRLTVDRSQYPDTGRRTARTVGHEYAIQRSAAKALVDGKFGYTVLHGGSVNGSYGYPAVTDSALTAATLHPDGIRVSLWTAQGPARNTSHGTAAERSLPGAGDAYYGGRTEATRQAAVQRIRQAHNQRARRGTHTANIHIPADVLRAFNTFRDSPGVFADYAQEHGLLSEEHANEIRANPSVETMASVILRPETIEDAKPSRYIVPQTRWPRAPRITAHDPNDFAQSPGSMPERLARRFNTNLGDWREAIRTAPEQTAYVHGIIADKLGDDEDLREDIVRDRRQGVRVTGDIHAREPNVSPEDIDAVDPLSSAGDGWPNTLYVNSPTDTSDVRVSRFRHPQFTHGPYYRVILHAGPSHMYTALWNHSQYDNWRSSMDDDDRKRFTFPDEQQVRKLAAIPPAGSGSVVVRVPTPTPVASTPKPRPRPQPTFILPG